MSTTPRPDSWRRTTQDLMPATRPPAPDGQYDLYPAFPLAPGLIQCGFEALAELLAGARTAVIDGYPGVLWEQFRRHLDAALAERGLRAHFVDVATALRDPQAIDALLAAFLGGDDPLFGFRYPGELADFYDPERLRQLRPDPERELNVLYGSGAALAGWAGPLIYVEVPKNEIQFRARARSVKNLGVAAPLEPRPAYKRAYFVDWPAANRHKAALHRRIDWFVDEQRPTQPCLISGPALRDGLSQMAHGVVRPRPWFEPGPWGGQWIKAHVPQLNQEVPNYAWSFELITPENGLVFQSGDLLLEVPFDTLMFQEAAAVLGDCAAAFGWEFPIRYDFLDTVEGGNLSIQVHPRPDYMRQHFGERFTQDECYYILDCVPGAQVNLGLQAGVEPAAFKAALRHSAVTGTPLAVDAFVQSFPARKHDFFRIPSGTVHGSGIGNLVLEISATPYIFTFKMYDWLRNDLDGKPRTLNIERAFENVVFERQGERVEHELIARPVILDEGADAQATWRLEHVPTHREHFYDLHRLTFSGTIALETSGSCHVLSLVDGPGLRVETAGGRAAAFHYAETFVVPAATRSYRLISPPGCSITVVKTFMKPASQWAPGVVPQEER